MGGGGGGVVEEAVGVGGGGGGGGGGGPPRRGRGGPALAPISENSGNRISEIEIQLFKHSVHGISLYGVWQ